MKYKLSIIIGLVLMIFCFNNIYAGSLLDDITNKFGWGITGSDDSGLGSSISGFILGDIKDIISQIGNFVLLICGVALGTKYVISSSMDKAVVKDSLITYCVALCMWALAGSLFELLESNLLSIFKDGNSIEDIMAVIWNTFKVVANIIVFIGLISIGIKYMFANSVDKSVRKIPEIYFVGNSISSTYMNHLKQVIGDRDFSINMISKSGTTTEPAIAFRVFKKLLEEKYGKEAAKSRIYATTDKAKGALKNLATEEGYESFVVPDDVGGRFSVLTAVGLLPIAASGVNIDDLMAGAASARTRALENAYEENDSLQYAAARNILYKKGKGIEILANYEPCVHFVSEWWKQLFGESEGKDQRGIFPASVDLTTDLHSMGQFIQDGARNLFETVIDIETSREEIILEEEAIDLDGLNYLAGKSVDFVNKSAMNGTILAHTDGQVPNLMVHIPEVNAFYLGELFYFFEFACGVSGYLLGINPFDQPGVESYKKNMFALLGKPGYEVEREALLKRL